MSKKLIRTLCLTAGLALGLGASTVTWAEDPPAKVAKQIRQQWKQARQDYLEAVKPYAKDPKYAQLAQNYASAMDDTGASLENFLSLKEASAPAQQLAPAVDKLAKNIKTLNSLKGQAKGDLTNVLGGALSQHNQVVQNALKNMR